jgi:hypothetical protein
MANDNDTGKNSQQWVTLFFTPFIIFILIMAAYMLLTPTEQGSGGPVKILYTGDVGGALDPCG